MAHRSCSRFASLHLSGLAAALLLATGSWAQPTALEPHLGYLYPAGAQEGSTVRIVAGGQLLRGVSGVHLTGDGVRATVIKHFRPAPNIDPDQRAELEHRFRQAFQQQAADLPGWGRLLGRRGMGANARSARTSDGGTLPPGVEPYEHPLVYDLESKSLLELQHSLTMLRFPRNRRQLNLQIAETVLIEVTVDPDAAPGDRELRLATPLGLSNPMVFQVGPTPEVSELEPNDPGPPAVSPRMPRLDLPAPPPLDLPVVVNGQIMPGDVDRFRVRARQGQRLVIEAQARRLIPYLADSVPGWFQATLALYDADGNKVAFEDDHRFDPDPVLLYQVPTSGVYELEIRDAIARGREDFIYRVSIGEQPFIEHIYPLGAREGSTTLAAIEGWNLTGERLDLDTRPGGDRVRTTVLLQGGTLSNPVTYAVDARAEADEIEPNDTAGRAQRVGPPLVVNGRIASPGDVDVFLLEGRVGDELVAEVEARRLGSPLDSVLRVTDLAGNLLEWNDDHEDAGAGLTTHHADSRLSVRLPEDGAVLVHLGDAQRHGGEDFAYRLRLGPPEPDFALRVTPSSINVPLRGAAPVTVHVLRRDGFDGVVELALTNAPPGFALHGGRIPAGSDHVRVTMTAGWEPLPGPVTVGLEGRAVIDGMRVTRPAVPAEDMMQAFAYRHLVPSHELVVAVRSRPPGLPATVTAKGPVRIPSDGTVQVRARLPQHPRLREVAYELVDPPDGVTLDSARLVPGGLELVLAADGKVAQVGLADNLIVGAFAESEGGPQSGGPSRQTRRVSLGVLPAIPFEIVQR